MTSPAPRDQPGNRSHWLAALGPGLLFAGAAIGVSHLVQSTRAGALYGLGLLPIIVLAHLLKYPAMVAAPYYAASTGRSLLHAYRQQGRHALAIFGLVTLGTMFTIQAALTLVTAATLSAFFGTVGTEAPLLGLAIGVNIVVAGLLAFGGFRWLDRVMKLLMGFMALATLAVLALEIPSLDLGSWRIDTAWMTSEDRLRLLVFVVALIGWMPAPLDIAAWDSLWILAKQKQSGIKASLRSVLGDFHLGFGVCILMAVAFLVLGTTQFHQTGTAADPRGGAFAAQIIGVYTARLGEWAGPLVALGAVAVMFTTLLTVSDAIPRAMLATVKHWHCATSDESHEDAEASRTRGYWLILAAQIIGGLGIVAGFQSSLPALVDLATTLSFLGTPLLAWINHRALTAPAVRASLGARRHLPAWSLFSLCVWIFFAAVYAWTLLVSE